jgi:hypothetical protein
MVESSLRKINVAVEILKSKGAKPTQKNVSISIRSKHPDNQKLLASEGHKRHRMVYSFIQKNK